jgi:hypothetical protein
VEFQSFVFSQIWADLGSFGQFWAVLDSFGQFWAKVAALTVAESLPEVWLKSLNPITLKP